MRKVTIVIYILFICNKKKGGLQMTEARKKLLIEISNVALAVVVKVWQTIMKNEEQKGENNNGSKC